MNDIATRLEAVRERIAAAEARFGRPAHSVRLLAVSKTHSAAAVAEALRAGQQAFGENYLQDARDKQQALEPGEARWHFIGPLQSNKTKAVAERFDWVHSLDRWKIARRLSEQRSADRPPLNVCLEVNIDGEATKSGLLPDEVPGLARATAELPGLRLRGLMAIPAPGEGFEAQRRPLRRLRELFDTLRDQGLTDLDTLSMGMSNDLEAAIAEGATIVRVGTAIFGPRQR
jgi:pyridoxal phosphate enzyme (YggS family)